MNSYGEGDRVRQLTSDRLGTIIKTTWGSTPASTSYVVQWDDVSLPEGLIYPHELQHCRAAECAENPRPSIKPK